LLVVLNVGLIDYTDLLFACSVQKPAENSQ